MTRSEYLYVFDDRTTRLCLAATFLVLALAACGGDSDDDGATPCESNDDCAATETCSAGACVTADAGADASMDADPDAATDAGSDPVDDPATDADPDATTDVATDTPEDVVQDTADDSGGDVAADTTDDGGDTSDVTDDATDAADDTTDVPVLLMDGEACTSGDECMSGACAEVLGGGASYCASDDQVCLVDDDMEALRETSGVICLDDATEARCDAGVWTETACDSAMVCGVSGCQICPADAETCAVVSDDGGLDIGRVSVGVLDGGADTSTAAIVLDVAPETADASVVMQTWSLDTDALGAVVYLTNEMAGGMSTDNGENSRIAVWGTGADAFAGVSWTDLGQANIRFLDADGTPEAGLAENNFPELDDGVALHDATISGADEVFGVAATVALPATGGGYSSNVFAMHLTTEVEYALVSTAGWPSAPYFQEVDMASVQDVRVTAVRTTRDTLDATCTFGTMRSRVTITNGIWATADQDSVQAFGAPGQDAVVLWTNDAREQVLTQVTYDSAGGCQVVGTTTLTTDVRVTQYEGAMWSDGSYVVVYVDDSGDAPVLMAARFGADGVADGEPVEVSLPGFVPDTPFGASTYGTGDDRGFVVAWSVGGTLYARSM